MSNVIKVKQTEKQMAHDFIIDVTLSGRPVEVVNAIQHKIALQLIEAGHAVIVGKKNYGRIAAVKGVN